MFKLATTALTICCMLFSILFQESRRTLFSRHLLITSVSVEIFAQLTSVSFRRPDFFRRDILYISTIILFLIENSKFEDFFLIRTVNFRGFEMNNFFSTTFLFSYFCP